MYLSHVALGLVLFTRLKENRLLSFFLVTLSVEVLDLLFALFAIVNLDSGTIFESVDNSFFSIPWSHSLLTVIVWTMGYGLLVYFLVKRTDSNEVTLVAILSGVGVFSHWIFDIIVHNTDMVLDPFSNPAIKVPTFYVWQSPIIAFILETLLILVFWGYFVYEMKKQDKFVNYNMVLGLIIMLILHFVFYAPSFISFQPMEMDLLVGINIIVLIVGVTYVLTLIHKNSTKIISY